MSNDSVSEESTKQKANYNCVCQIKESFENNSSADFYPVK